ncbi:MAG: serine hydrolase [Candidatus Delongbacteria bacterium]|nr:serine hydrolase [Candidatus Delongbacteria bacterium]
MKKLIILVLLLLTCQMFGREEPMKRLELEQELTGIIKEGHGNYAVAFKDIQTGETILINEKERFHAASTMKTPVMIEVFYQAEQKKFALEDSIPIINQFSSLADGSPFSVDKSSDSEPSLYDRIGRKAAIQELVFHMITSSSNLATNLLIQLVSPVEVMEQMKKLGANDIQVLRGVEDGKAYEAGMNNTTTAYDLMLLFDYLAGGKLISPKANQQMLDILFKQNFNDMIPAQLPPEVKVAHKTGSISNVQHDSGIVFLPDGRKYVLVILSNKLKSNADGIQTIAKLSHVIYRYMLSKE